MSRTVTVTGTFDCPDFIGGNLEDFADWCQNALITQGPSWITPCTYLPSASVVAAAAGVPEVIIFNLNAEYGSRVIYPTPPPA